MKSPVKAETYYLVDVGGETYQFKGLVENGGLVYDDVNEYVEFSGWNLDDFVVTVVYVDAGGAIHRADTVPGTDEVLVGTETYICLTNAMNTAGISVGDDFVIEVHRFDAGVKEPAVLYTIEDER